MWKEGVVVVRSGPTSYVIQMQGGEMLWKKHIDHIKPLIFASSSSSSLPQVIPSQAAQHGEPSPYLPCIPDLPPVKLTNPGQGTTEGAAAPAKTTLTQSAVSSSWQTSTPNSAECAPLPVVVSNNTNTPSQMEGNPPAPSSSSMDPPTLVQVPQQVATEAPILQCRYPSRNRRPPDSF